MIAIDTNVLVRFLTGDDQQQFKKARTLFETDEVFIPDTVILESEWVLRYAYRFPRDSIRSAFVKLFGLRNVHVNNPLLIAQVLQWYERGLDFADAMHLAFGQKCPQFFTFDRKFARRANGLSNCTIMSP